MLGLFVLSFVLIPWFSFAQVSDIYYPNPSMSDCVSIVNNLRYRDRDVNKNGEVSTLQDFLQGKGYLNNEPTGYFGLLTTKAVKDFQRANNINSDGSVGPITRAKIQALTCGGTNYNDPVISGTQGPQNLSINETGTWRILATDSSGGSLSYSVNWGDNMVYGNGTTSMYPQPLPIQQSATFTHSYSQRGTYTPTFTVTSDNGIRCIMAPCPSGGSASTSLSVNVGGETSNSSIMVLSPNGGETLFQGNNFRINWQDNTSYGCPVGANCITMPAPRFYDIYLIHYSFPCYYQCPLAALAPYTIAKGVYGTAYNWQLDYNTIYNLLGDDVQSGQYKISVCRAGTSTCDTSDSPFTIKE